MLLVVRRGCLYGYCATLVLGIDYFIVSFFGGYPEMENQHAYDCYGQCMWFIIGFRVEIFRRSPGEFYVYDYFGRSTCFLPVVLKKTYPLANLYWFFIRNQFSGSYVLLISLFYGPKCLAGL